MQRLSIEKLPPEAGVSLVHDLARNNSVPYAASVIDAGRRMTFDIRHRALSDVVVTRVRAGNYLATRGEDLVRASEPRVILQLPRRPVATDHRGHQVRSGPRSLVAMWSLDPLRTQIGPPALIHAVTVPLEQVGLPHRLMQDLMGRDLGASRFAPVFAAYLRRLTRADLDEAEAAAAAGPTSDLVRLVLASAAGDGERCRQSLADTLGTRILLHLRSRLHDPELTADSVAAHFHISRRSLYLILGRLDVPLGAWLRAERLKRAAALLGDPSQAHLSVAEIARRVGFGDHSSFSRAFRDRYGRSPSEWRAEHP